MRVEATNGCCNIKAKCENKKIAYPLSRYATIARRLSVDNNFMLIKREDGSIKIENLVRDNACRGSRLVGVRGFEPPASWSRTKHSTKLSHTPKILDKYSIKKGVCQVYFHTFTLLVMVMMMVMMVVMSFFFIKSYTAYFFMAQFVLFFKLHGYVAYSMLV